jgi:hypothetical protein
VCSHPDAAFTNVTLGEGYLCTAKRVVETRSLICSHLGDEYSSVELNLPVTEMYSGAASCPLSLILPVASKIESQHVRHRLM